jgi:hypothetical protein
MSPELVASSISSSLQPPSGPMTTVSPESCTASGRQSALDFFQPAFSGPAPTQLFREYQGRLALQVTAELLKSDRLVDLDQPSSSDCLMAPSEIRCQRWSRCSLRSSDHSDLAVFGDDWRDSRDAKLGRLLNDKVKLLPT